MKTVTFWVVVQGDTLSDLAIGEAAYYRKTAIRWHCQLYAQSWESLRASGWRVRKVMIPWEQVKP